MATFRLYAKTKIGSGNRMVSEGAFIQICKNSTSTPTTSEIKQAIKNQLGIDVNTTPHLGQFNYEMIR